MICFYWHHLFRLARSTDQKRPGGLLALPSKTHEQDLEAPNGQSAAATLTPKRRHAPSDHAQQTSVCICGCNNVFHILYFTFASET